MSRTTAGACALGLLALAAAMLVLAIPAGAAGGRIGFGFGEASVSGFPSGAAFVSGGGAYDPVTGSVHSGGAFRCLSDVQQGPLTGCLAGQGVRWDTDALLRNTTFKCTGAAGEPLKAAFTDGRTVVLLADFYRAGDGDDASFKGVKMIVSDHDIAPDVAGVQNVWIEKVGCGTSTSHLAG